MVFRKLPGVFASGMGLRLSQKFVFLLFLSGLVTLCFGALFFLPDSVRLKRIFLPKTDNQAVTVGSENDVRDHSKKMSQQTAKGDSTTKLKMLSRKQSVTHKARTVERSIGNKPPEEWSPSKTKTEPVARARESVTGGDRVTTSTQNGQHKDTFDFERFKQCLVKAPMGSDNGKPSDPQTQQRREKVKEVSRS